MIKKRDVATKVFHNVFEGDKHMFHLTDNQLTSQNLCKYADDNGNTALVRRIDERRFVMKVRLKDSVVKIEPIEVDPYSEDGGVNLKFSAAVSSDMTGSIDDLIEQSVIDDIGALIQYWIDMIQDMNFISTDDQHIAHYNKDFRTADIIGFKVSLMEDYEELRPLANMLKAEQT